MFELESYLAEEGCDPFKDWLARLADQMTKARILVRTSRLSAGNFGDCKPLREGVWELRITAFTTPRPAAA